MTLFEMIKDQVPVQTAAEQYGIHVNRSGMCKCPFHQDKDPSMKFYNKRFHCFGCTADGDVIDFTSRLFNISLTDATRKLAADFGIRYDQSFTYSVNPKHHEISEADKLKHQINYCYTELADYRNQLVRWQEQYAPRSLDEDLHPLFLEAIHNLDRVEYQLDMLLDGSNAEKQEILNDYNMNFSKKEVPQMDPIVKTPVYHESAAYAREHGELDQFRNSHWTNIACKNDIEDAIARHFDGMHLDKEAVTEVLERYGAERMSMVLAATVQVKAWDGRFSNANKDWAFSFEIADTHTARGFDRRDEYAVASHPAVLDGFIKLARQEIKTLEHPVIKEESKQAAFPDAKAPKRKPQSMER